MAGIPVRMGDGGLLHELKCWPEFFERIKDGSKTFEVRRDDRGFQAGDSVLLREFDPSVRGVLEKGAYTDRSLLARIGFVLHAVPQTHGFAPGLNLGDWVVFSLLDVRDGSKP